MGTAPTAHYRSVARIASDLTLILLQWGAARTRRPGRSAATPPCQVSDPKRDLLRRRHKFCEVDVQTSPDRWIVAIGGSVVCSPDWARWCWVFPGFI
jgi:hypothetical protein